MEMISEGEAGEPGYERAFEAMLEMNKKDLAALEAAYEGRSSS